MALNETKKLEAILLSSGGEISKKELSETWGMDAGALTSALEEIASLDRAYTVIESNESVKLVLREEASEFVAAQETEKKPREMGNAGAEVLACILYAGSLSKGEIDEMRGFNSRSTIQDLVKRGYLEETEEKKYALTTDALASLGIEKREDAPEFDTISRELKQDSSEE